MSTTTETTAGELRASDLGTRIEFRTTLPAGDITADLTGTLAGITQAPDVSTIEITDHTGNTLTPVQFPVRPETSVTVIR